MAFVYLMENISALDEQIVLAHVDYLKALDREGKLILCGPFSDYAGGMVILNCKDMDEAKRIAENDPFILSKYKTYQMRTLDLANKDNNYGLN